VKNRFIALLAMLALCLGLGVVATSPASAYIDDPYINGRKFWTTSICIGTTLLPSYYRVGYVAQSINNNTIMPSLQVSTNCQAAGYGPSARMVVGTFQNASYPYCTLFTNQQHDVYNGYWRWTNGPGLYLNTGLPGCVSTQVQRDHWISQMIAWHLGLNTLDAGASQDRVMDIGAYSRDHVPLPIGAEYSKIDAVYLGLFCDSGTTC
jgi:hypothetical protein